MLAATGIRRIFSRPRFVALAFAVALVGYAAGVILPNLMLVEATHWSRAALEALLLSPASSRNAVGLVNLFGGAIFLGANVAAAAAVFSRRLSVAKAAGAGALGLAASVLGLGCGSCGALLFGAIAPAAFGSFLAGAPLHGAEIGLLGLLISALALLALGRAYAKPAVCRE